MSDNISPIFDPFSSMTFSQEECFLCGVKLIEQNKSEEHIFPKWLQQRFNLWNHTVHLLNGTLIPYRMLKIPCCTTCNGIHLSNLENIIKNGVEKGYEEFIKIDRLKIFQWIVKIFYGLLFRELTLNVDQRDSSKGTITTPELLKSYKMTHTFLQSVRTPIEFVDFFPWSIHILRGGQEYGDERDFHYIDGLNTLTFSIKLGEIIIITNLQDNGILEERKSDYFKKLENVKLHKIQFIELAVKYAYSSYLLDYNPFYMMTKSINLDSTLQIYSLNRSYTVGEWNNYQYADILYFYYKQTHDYLEFEDLYVEGNDSEEKVVTTLFNEDGSFQELPSDVHVVFKKQNRFT